MHVVLIMVKVISEPCCSERDREGERESSSFDHSSNTLQYDHVHHLNIKLALKDLKIKLPLKVTLE